MPKTNEPNGPKVVGGKAFRWKTRKPVPERLDRKTTVIKQTVETSDLETLIGFARKLGVRDGISIRAKEIEINEVMRFKCRIPTCWGYNSSYLCPPHSAAAVETQALIDEFEWALLLNIPVPDQGWAEYSDQFDYINRVKEIVGRTEVEAQYTGYLNSMGFAGGPCTSCGVFSSDWLQAKESGQELPTCPLVERKVPICPQYQHCRPAAQSVGMDMYATAHRVGWDSRLALPRPRMGSHLGWPCLPGVYPILIG